MKGLPELDEYEKKVSVYGLWATLREKVIINNILTIIVILI